MEFTDKIVLITGASAGLGAATAIYLSKQSAKLVLVGCNGKNLKIIALRCEKSKGIKPLSIGADVTEQTDAERIISETIEKFGKLDVLINHPEVPEMSGIKKSTMETDDKIMSKNIKAMCQLSMLALPHLTTSKGCILNVFYTSTTKPSTIISAYNDLKAALGRLAKCISLELSPEGIRVNSTNPGFMKSNLLKNIGITEEQLQLNVNNVGGNKPLKKPVEGDELAALIAYLARNKEKSFTGSNLITDGGSSLR